MVVSIDQAFYNVSLGLTFSLIALKVIFAYIFLRHYYKNRQNQLILGAAIFFFFLFISRILMMYFDYFLTEFNPESYQSYIIFWKAGNAFTWIGFFWLIFMSERAIFKAKTKYIISIVYVVFIIISLTYTDYLTSQLMAAIPTAVALIFIPFSYLYLARLEGLRKYALAVFFGYIFYLAIGFGLLAEGIVTSLASISSLDPYTVRLSLHIVSAIIKICSLVLFLYGYRIEIEIKIK